MTAELSLDIFVDQEPDGTEISESAATGAWVSIRDSEGHLHVPASTPMGRAIMARKLQVSPASESFGAAKDLSTLPGRREQTFQRIQALLGNNL